MLAGTLVLISCFTAGALASKELGKHFGMYLAWLPHYNQSLVFRSPGKLKVNFEETGFQSFRF